MKLNQWSLDISDDEAWTDDDYFSYFWGGIRVKKLSLRTNMRSARQALHAGGMAGDQRHNQHVQERDPWKTSLGECVMPEQAEEEHSARFVWQMAAAISCGTAKRLQFRLGVPHSPALQPLVQSNKPWWIAPPSNTVSEYMMVPTGIHLPCCHPASSPATYHPMDPPSWSSHLT